MFWETSSQLVNTQTGESFSLEDQSSKQNLDLTKRENQILHLVKRGLLSKEISHQLNISVHTANTHHQ